VAPAPRGSARPASANGAGSLTIKQNGTTLIVGQTQYGGKTHLARWHAAALPSVIVYDWKGGFDLPNARITSRFDELIGEPRAVFRPAKYDYQEWRRLCAYVLARRYTVLVDDEASIHFMERGVGEIAPEHFQVITMGMDPRTFGCGYWCLTQRVSDGVHNAIHHNAHTVIAFLCPGDRDRAKLGQIIGSRGAEMTATLPEHAYVFYQHGMPEPVLCPPLGGVLTVAPRSQPTATAATAATSPEK
jgi:hypothetical protein